MIKKRENASKVKLKKGKSNKIKMKFKREIRKVNIHDFIMNTTKNSKMKENLMKMNSIQDHFELKGVKKIQMISERENRIKARKQLKSRNLLKYMNTDNREINIELEVKMDHAKIRVRHC